MNDYFKFSLDHSYLIPLSKEGESEFVEYLVRPSIREGDRGRIVVIEKDGYRTKRMYKQYFEWLIYQNYIKVLDNQ